MTSFGNRLVCVTDCHKEHGQEWSFTSPTDHEAMVCVACLVQVLEDPDTLPTKLKFILGELLGVFGQHAARLEELLIQDDRVAAHMTSLLLGVMTASNPGVSKMACEGAVNILCIVKSEDLTAAVLDMCTQGVLEVCDYRRTLPVFFFISRLLTEMPGLANQLLRHNGSLIECAISGLSFPDEEIQSCLLFTLLKLYGQSVCSEVYQEQMYTALKAVLALMVKCDGLDIVLNGLGVLKVMLGYQHLLSHLVHSNEAVLLAGAIRRMLMRSEDAIQITTAQIITVAINGGGKDVAALFLEHDISEFLYEKLATRNELLLSSVFCCLLLLTESETFFTKCHFVYGIESLLLAIEESFRHHRSQAGVQGMSLLAKLIDRHSVGVQLSGKTGWLSHSLRLITKGLKHPSLPVACEACAALLASLRRDHLPSPVPYPELLPCVQAAVERLVSVSEKEEAGGHSAKPESKSLVWLHEVLKLLIKACSLLAQSRLATSEDRPTERQLQRAEEEQFFDFLLTITDTMVLPLAIAQAERCENNQVTDLFTLLRDLCSICSAQKQQQLSQKLAASGFITWTLEKCIFSSRMTETEKRFGSDLLLHICMKLNPDVTISPASEIGFQHFMEKNENFLQPLIEGSTDTNKAVLLLLYTCFLQGDSPVTVPALAPALDQFFKNTVELPDTSILKMATYLFAVCSMDKEGCCRISSNGEAQLGKWLTLCEDVGCWFTHRQDFLEWCLSNNTVIMTCGRQLLEYLLTDKCSHTSSNQFNIDQDLIVNLVSMNTVFLKSIMNGLKPPNKEGKISEVLRFLSTVFAHIQVKGKGGEDIEEVLQLYKEEIPQLLLQTLLNHQDCKTGDALRDLLGLYVDIKLLLDSSLLPEDVKISYHVCRWLETQSLELEQEDMTHCLNLLTCLVGVSLRAEDNAVAGIISASEKVMSLLGKSIKEPLYFSLCGSLLCLLEQHCQTGQLRAKHHALIEKSLLFSAVRRRDPATQLVAVQLWTLYFVPSPPDGSIICLQNSSKKTSVQDDNDSNNVLTTDDIRALFIYFQQLLCNESPSIRLATVHCIKIMIDNLDKTNPSLSKHLREQPWNQMLLRVMLVNCGEEQCSGCLITFVATILTEDNCLCIPENIFKLLLDSFVEKVDQGKEITPDHRRVVKQILGRRGTSLEPALLESAKQKLENLKPLNAKSHHPPCSLHMTEGQVLVQLRH